MVYPLTSGVSVNVKARCLVREKPKDRERLDELRKASTKRVAFGIDIPFTTFEGIPDEELPFQANEVPQKEGRSSAHPTNRPGAQMGSDLESQPPTMISPILQPPKTSLSRPNPIQGSQRAQRTPPSMVAGGLPPELPSRGRGHGQQSRNSTHDSRRSRRNSQVSQLTNQQPQSPENPTNMAGKMHPDFFDSQNRESFVSQMSVDKAPDTQKEFPSLSVGNQRSRQSAREPSHQKQTRPIPQRVQDLFAEGSRSSRNTQESQRTSHSARQMVQEQQIRSTTYVSSLNERANACSKENWKHSRQ